MTTFTESVVEQAALAWLESLGLPAGEAGWRVTHGLKIEPGESKAERIIGKVC